MSKAHRHPQAQTDKSFTSEIYPVWSHRKDAPLVWLVNNKGVKTSTGGQRWVDESLCAWAIGMAIENRIVWSMGIACHWAHQFPLSMPACFFLTVVHCKTNSCIHAAGNLKKDANCPSCNDCKMIISILYNSISSARAGKEKLNENKCSTNILSIRPF